MRRLKYNLKAMEMYEVELKESIKGEDDFKIYLNIGNLLHWIIMTEEWHRKHNSKKYKYERNNISGLMEAIRFANNSMKHNMIFKRIHLNPTAIPCGSEEAICGTFSCGTDEVLWNSVIGFKSNIPWRIEQYNCYNKHLKLKNIIDSLAPVIKFLKLETDSYLITNS